MRSVVKFGRHNTLQGLDCTRHMLHSSPMNARQIMALLKENGWKLDRINGSHHVFVKDGMRSVAVPLHGNKDLGAFAKRLLAQAGIRGDK